MWVGKGLVVGVVGILALGAVVLAVETDSLAGAPRLDDSSMTVPVGNVGDRVTYASFVEGELGGNPWTWDAEGDSETPDSQWGFEVAPVVATNQRYGGTHDTVVVRVTPDRGWAWPHYEYFDFGREDVDRSKNLKIDLATRAIVARTWDWESGPVPSPLGATTYAGANTVYGPNWWGVNLGPGYWDFTNGDPEGWMEFLPLAFQAEAFRLGDELTPPLSTLILAQESNGGLPPTFNGSISGPVWRDFDFGAKVVDRRFVGPYDAYDLRYDGCMVIHNAGLSTSTTVPWLGVDVPYEAKTCYQVDVWVSDEVPYPVLVQTRILVDGEAHHYRVDSLSAVELGETPIPWAPREWPSWDRFRLSSPEPEIGPTKHPAEGSRSGLEFGLDEAVSMIQASPVLVQFQEWQVTHPDSWIVGYELTPREGGLLRWTIVFGAPPDEAFVVTIQKEPGQPAQPPREEGAFAIEELSASGGLDSDFYQDFTTLGHVAAAWRDTMTRDGAVPAPNLVKWGDQYRPPTLNCRTATDCTLQEARVTDGSPEAMLVGHTSTQEAAGPVNFGPLEPLASSEDSYVVGFVKWADFHITASGHAHEFGTFSPLAGAGDPPASAGTPASGATGISDVGTSVLVTSSLLALFLVAYFLPLLREHGLKLLLFIPLYAKLRKKDLLNNEYRDGIATLVQEEPGITAPELQKAVGGSLSTVVYHLRVLEKNKLISSLVDGRYKRFFPTEQVSWGERGRIAALRNAKTREIYSVIHAEPGLAPKDLSRRARISRPTVYWHVDRLARVGLVAHDKERGRARFYASDPNFLPGEGRTVGGAEVA